MYPPMIQRLIKDVSENLTHPTAALHLYYYKGKLPTSGEWMHNTV